jgi:4-diphosphocytidyl-2-C-methyl-D-erythritol kinase
LEVIARRIGVDVAFFVNGGTAVGIGRGDEINSINEPIHLWILLVCPNLSIGSKTRTLYSRVRPNLFTSGQITRDLSLLVSDPMRLTEGLYNAFEPLAFDVFDGLNQVVSDMRKAGIKTPHLSGTGPCLYGFVDDQQFGIRIRKQLVELGYVVHLIRTTQSSSLLTLGQSNN